MRKRKLHQDFLDGIYSYVCNAIKYNDMNIKWQNREDVDRKEDIEHFELKMQFWVKVEVLDNLI